MPSAVLYCTLLGLWIAAPANASPYPSASAVASGTVLNAAGNAGNKLTDTPATVEHSIPGASELFSRLFSGSSSAPEESAETVAKAPATVDNITHIPSELGEPDSSPALFAARIELDVTPPAKDASVVQAQEHNTAPASQPFATQLDAQLGEPDDSPSLFETRKELEPVNDPSAISRILSSFTKPSSNGDGTQTAANNSQPAAPASYQSPGIVVKKETFHQSQLQPELSPSEIKMASLTPNSGTVASDSGPLIQLPEAPAPAAPLPSPAAPAAAKPAAKPEITTKTIGTAEPVQKTLPASTPTPVTTASDVSEPAQELSPASKAVLKKIPQTLSPPSPKVNEPFAVDHVKKIEKTDTLNASSSVQHEKMGVKIELKAPTMDLNYELEKAYNAMIAGEQEMAISIYKNILENDAKNKNALFGLGTLYHRAGQIDMARTLYSRLLSLDPNHRDGLNNFLVLIADEAPEAALSQLEALEKRDPRFSPIPAQMAIIYEKMGDMDKASEKMFRAVDLAPENLVYRYNLAIMLDKQKKYGEAGKLYHQIVDAYQRGENVPGNIQQIQQRLAFISASKP